MNQVCSAGCDQFRKGASQSCNARQASSLHVVGVLAVEYFQAGPIPPGFVAGYHQTLRLRPLPGAGRAALVYPDVPPSFHTEGLVSTRAPAQWLRRKGTTIAVEVLYCI